MTKRLFAFLLVFGVAAAIAQENKTMEKSQTGKETKFVLTSSAFEEGAMIPKVYTCDSTDISPELSWSGAPEGTKSFALIADDPDAPSKTWVHWVAYNIDPAVSKLKEGIESKEIPDSTIHQGVSDFGKFGYGGPCPPSGVHRYFFKLYALDTMLELKGKVTKADLLDAIEGHVLAETQLMGKYTREK